MIVGKYLKKVYYKNKLYKIIIAILGCLDLHTQIRTKPLFKFVKSNNNYFDEKVIVEIGCGSGNNCFELLEYCKPKKIRGCDIDAKSILEANNIASQLKVEEVVVFECNDASNLLKENEKVDVLLLIDFLEHIPNPQLFLSQIKFMLNENAIIVVSVPTYFYKKVFGLNFHIKVGHVKDGYTLDELKILFKEINYIPLLHSYNTGLFANIGCFFYYRIDLKNKYLNFIKQILLYPFAFLDFFNGENVSCSLFVVFRRC